MVAIVVISGLGLLGFAAVITGLAEPLIDSVREIAAGIEWPQWLATTPSDTTPPAISNVEVLDIALTSAIITWETDEPAASQVMICDPNGVFTWTETDPTLATSHSVRLSNLKPNTAYHYTVISLDAAENEGTGEGDFTTSAQADTTPPVISGVAVSDAGESSATISWATDELATSQVEYGTTDAYGSTTPLGEELLTSHRVTLAGLEPDTTYHFIVKSQDAAGNEATSETAQTFATLSALPADLEEGTKVGMRAPDFTLQTIDGESITLSNFRGKIVILNFWASNRQCSREMPCIQQVYDKWPGEELTILAINHKEMEKDVQKFIDEKQLTLPVLLDPTGEVADDKYHISLKPTTFFIDAQGIIREKREMPFNSPQQIESVLESL